MKRFYNQIKFDILLLESADVLQTSEGDFSGNENDTVIPDWN